MCLFVKYSKLKSFLSRLKSKHWHIHCFCAKVTIYCFWTALHIDIICQNNYNNYNFGMISVPIASYLGTCNLTYLLYITLFLYLLRVLKFHMKFAFGGQAVSD